MRINRDIFFVTKNTKYRNLIHSYQADNSIQGWHEAVNGDPYRSEQVTFHTRSSLLTNILSFLAESIQRIKELLYPELIRSFDVVPDRFRVK